MNITDIIGQRSVCSEDELEAALQRRVNSNVNAFWLSSDTSSYPMLSILVKDDFAALDFLHNDGDVGSKSIGNLKTVDIDGSTVFSISTYEADDLEIQNDSLVEWPLAIQAAKEFFITSEQPNCIEWFEL